MELLSVRNWFSDGNEVRIVTYVIADDTWFVSSSDFIISLPMVDTLKTYVVGGESSGSSTSVIVVDD